MIRLFQVLFAMIDVGAHAGNIEDYQSRYCEFESLPSHVVYADWCMICVSLSFISTGKRKHNHLYMIDG